jgi:DNA-binding PadR family transcriptional regulator
MTTRAMQEATLLVLTALAAGSQHGHGIITDVREISAGRVRLRVGTLYTALDRLRADGLIGIDREEIVDSRLRRYYRLTHAGGRRLLAGAASLGHRRAAGSDLRIGDAEREATVAVLSEHFAQGRLTLEELDERLDAAFAATTQGQISRITWDLPHVITP